MSYHNFLHDPEKHDYLNTSYLNTNFLHMYRYVLHAIRPYHLVVYIKQYCI